MEALAVIDWGLSREEFWSLDGDQIKAFLKVHKNKRIREDYRSAQICWILAEINRDKKQRARPFKVDEFIIEPKEEKKQKGQSSDRKMQEFSLYLEQVRALSNG